MSTWEREKVGGRRRSPSPAVPTFPALAARASHWSLLICHLTPAFRGPRPSPNPSLRGRGVQAAVVTVPPLRGDYRGVEIDGGRVPRLSPNPSSPQRVAAGDLEGRGVSVAHPSAPRPRGPLTPWPLGPSPALRPAFTLIEMLVSLAVLALALGIVGVVFAVATRTASQSAAYSEAYNWVRQWTQEIERDLDACRPSESILVLVGRTQAAALTQADLDAGKFHRLLIGDPAQVPQGYDPAYSPNVNAQYSNPRADLLMFFTNRPAVSAAPPTGANPANPHLAAGGKQERLLVTYGHAALGEPVFSGGAWQFPNVNTLKHIGDTMNVLGNELSVLPACRWHLARRATIITPVTNWPNTDRFSNIALQSIPGCQPYRDGGADMAGDQAFLNPAFLFATCGPGYYSQSGPAVSSPYGFAPYLPQQLLAAVASLLYHPGSPQNRRHVATVLERVPVDLQSNLGVHMLPGCAWFQVEFLMPEDPRNSVEYSSPDPSLSQRSDMPRWTAVQDGYTYVFVPDTPENRQAIANQLNSVGGPTGRLATFGRLDQTPSRDTDPDYRWKVADPSFGGRMVRLWPYAIRITVRVYDPRGRLDEPIIRSIVHRFE
ncbi:MAG: prepilin-type N-terminal cleavage/methylation domain-containing protein [Planctomycetota bacterium]